MSDYRLKIKIGDHEFEAEGPADAVQSQFQSFKELIANLPKHTPDTNDRSDEDSATPEKAANPAQFDKIFRADARVVSLTAPPEAVIDAILLVLLGQRHYRNNETVTGAEVMDGMLQSGYRIPRVDRLIDRLATEGLVIKIGAHRSSRYRLSNQGLVRAQGLARDVLSRVP